MSDRKFSWESDEYRAARADLHRAESDLLDQIEAVARQRRALPPVGSVPSDYRYQDGSSDVSLADLFEDRGKPLILVHYMFADDAENPCPMCTLWADGYDALVPHLTQMASVALVAKADVGKLKAVADRRGWSNLRVLSSRGSTFNRDFAVEDADGTQQPGVSVFTLTDDGAVEHFYSTEMARERGIDLLTPFWHLLDLLPKGRQDFMPRLDYGAAEPATA